jgi:hypothetical protein
VWDLVAVAWDYAASSRGGYPGYDDAEKNMPLPEGRNVLAAQMIRETARPSAFGGFSSDLYILHGSFYETLKRGEVYRGYYAAPFQDIVRIYGGVGKEK